MKKFKMKREVGFEKLQIRTPIAILLALNLFCLAGCKEEQSIVDLGPKTDARIQRGESAEQKLKSLEKSQDTQKEILNKAERLEEELQGYIEKSKGAGEPSERRTGKLILANGSCFAQIIQDKLLIADRIDAILGDDIDGVRKCETFSIKTDRLVIPEGFVLSSRGRT